MVRFLNLATGFMLDCNGKGNVYTMRDSGGNYQNWIVKSISNGCILENVATGRILDSNSEGKVFTSKAKNRSFQI